MDLKMKKLLALLLAGALLTVGLASCSKKNADKDDRDASYVEDEVVVNDVRLESVDADGNAQKDENGLRIYEYFRFETIDDETVELVSFRSEVLGSAAGETPSYLPCYTPHTVVIPATLGGKTVTNIGASAFKQRTEITAVVIPDTVAVIGNYAFDECDALTAVSLPAGLTTLGEAAFYKCANLASLTFADGAPLETISKAAFQGCTSLTSVSIPASVRTIAEGAFLGCTALASVTVAEGVTRIEAQAFQNLSALASLSLPASVTYLGGYNFYGSPLLTDANATAPAGSVADAFLARLLAGDPPVEAVEAAE